MAITFKKADSLFARIKEDLSSYDSLGLIDEGKFYNYVKYIIDQLGVSVYEEGQAVLKVKDFTAELPCDFSLMEAAYKCACPPVVPGARDNFQGGKVYYIDTTCEDIKPDVDHCNISCEKTGEVLHKVTVREYIKGIENTYNYTHPTLLRIMERNSQGKCAKNCKNFSSYQCNNFITIADKKIYTDFNNAVIYIQYWAFPRDEETGLPLIPDVPVIENAIEYYIKWKIFEQLWLNGDDNNIQAKLQLLRQEYSTAMGDATYYVKIPSFNSLMENIRRNRKRFSIYNIR